jgi:thymidylate synthase
MNMYETLHQQGALSSAEMSYVAVLWNVGGFGNKYHPTSDDRTGVGIRSAYGMSVHFPDISREFPLLQGKFVSPRLPFEEIMWMLSGSTSVRPLQEKKVRIWDEWADEHGDLGMVYGAQWRGKDPAQPVDQVEALLQQAEQSIRSGVVNRRMLIDSWTPSSVHNGSMRLPPCHFAWQLHLRLGAADEVWDAGMTVYMRSVDVFLGLPFNMAGYGFLLMLLCQTLRRRCSVAGAEPRIRPRNLTIHMGDCHVYLNHRDAAQRYLEEVYTRACDIRDIRRTWPTVAVEVKRRLPSVEDYRWEDVVVHGHAPGPSIPAEVAV